MTSLFGHTFMLYVDVQSHGLWLLLTISCDKSHVTSLSLSHPYVAYVSIKWAHLLTPMFKPQMSYL